MVRVMPHGSQDSYIQCPTPSLDTHRKVWLSLLWALELLQQCENFFGITVLQFVGCLLSGPIVELMAASSKRTDATCHASQLCCSQSPHPHSRSLLTYTSTGDTQTLNGWSGCIFCGGHFYFP